LFDNPYKFCSEEREKQQWNNQEHLDAALNMARSSIVLLKNSSPLNPPKGDFENTLPIRNYSYKKIALIGPLIKSVKEHLGFWSYDWDDDTARIGSLYDAINRENEKYHIQPHKLLYAKGCDIADTSKAGFAEAIEIANQSDVVVMYVGEGRTMTGEAKSKSNIHLPGVQEELIKAIHATGKPVVVIIGAGRPLVFNWTAENIPAILYTWWLGTKGPEAIADVLFGDYNPSGKLPMSFPRSEGQIPIYYNYYNTGRPAANDSDVNYVSAYLDLPNSPQYAFGHGLSYTTFNYSDIALSPSPLERVGERFKGNQTLTATVTITNTGDYDGEEVVQLYIRDKVGSVVRPVKELKGFQKVMLKKGESKKVSFTITTDMLKFYDDKLNHIWEPGEFEIMVGGSSREVKSIHISWQK
jgi:beta-glucosidase